LLRLCFRITLYIHIYMYTTTIKYYFGLHEGASVITTCTTFYIIFWLGTVMEKKTGDLLHIIALVLCIWGGLSPWTRLNPCACLLNNFEIKFQFIFRLIQMFTRSLNARVLWMGFCPLGYVDKLDCLIRNHTTKTWVKNHHFSMLDFKFKATIFHTYFILPRQTMELYAKFLQTTLASIVAGTYPQ